MTKPQKTAALWFLGGVALVVSGLIAEPRRALAVVAGVLFFAVGISTLARSRGSLAPRSR